MSNPDHHAPIASAMAGEASALDALWRAHRRWVAGVLLAHRPAGTDLDDLLQDVAVALVRHISGLQDPSAFRPWLRSIAINVARTAARRHDTRPRGPVPLAPGRDQLAGPDVDGAYRAEARDEVERTLRDIEQLPRDLREPLLLRALQGLTQREIADVLDVPETTVETRLARARRTLRRSTPSVACHRANGRTTR